MASAQKLTIRNKNGRIQQYGYVGGYDLGPFGASILNSEKTRSTLDRPKAIEALQFNIDLEKKYKVSPTGVSANGEVSGTGMTPDMLFQAGRVAMFRGNTWNLPDFRKKITAFDWDITLIPIAKKRSHWASSGGYAISSQTKNPEEAWLFFKFLISPEAQRITSAITIPICRDVAEDVIKDNTPPPANIKAFLDAVPYLQPFPRVSNTSAVVEKYFRATEEASIGKKTPESALREAANAINDLLKDNRKRKN